MRLIVPAVTVFLLLLVFAGTPVPAVEPGAALPVLTSVTARLPEQRPSGGLAWSRAHYPNEYLPANTQAVDLTGIDDRKNERFIDVGGSSYSEAFVSAFSYTDDKPRHPTVRLEYLKRTETFVGRLTATGLKPNFAYQLKLRGVPADKTAFERLGYLGRWRLPGDGTNCTDAQYRALADKTGVEAYLFFDFVVTDAAGRAEKEFYADSSLHVLFADRQQDPGGYAVAVTASRAGARPDDYANPRQDFAPIKVFAQSEEHALADQGAPDQHRPRVGLAFLPPGKYQAEFALTEESFHWYGDGGWWATVMHAPVAFEVIDQPRPSPYWTTTVPATRNLSPANAVIHDIQVTTRTDAALTGTAQSTAAAILFRESVRFPEAQRYCLSVDLLCAAEHIWQVVLSTGADYAERSTFTINAKGTPGWRRYEVEVTNQVAGDRAQVLLVPTLGRDAVGVQNVHFCVIRN